MFSTLLCIKVGFFKKIKIGGLVIHILLGKKKYRLKDLGGEILFASDLKIVYRATDEMYYYYNVHLIEFLHFCYLLYFNYNIRI